MILDTCICECDVQKYLKWIDENLAEYCQFVISCLIIAAFTLYNDKLVNQCAARSSH